MMCRSCDSSQVKSIFSFGELPLANRLLKLEELNDHEPYLNLEIMLCMGCCLVQLKETVAPTELFDNYLYFSSNSETMLESSANLVKKIIPSLKPGATIIELASNDGYLLKNYLNKGLKVLGVEPALNIANYANEQGIPTKAKYFSFNFSEQLKNEGFEADVIHANNVLAHVPNINDFIAGIKNILKADGRFILEVPYLMDLVANTAFDTIYHEHIFYFSLIALNELCKRHNLQIYNMERLPIHGGSIRLFISHAGEYTVSTSLKIQINIEKEHKINELSFYQEFVNRIYNLKEKLIKELNLLKKTNKKIAVYGASAKSTVLLNFFNLGRELIDFVVDRSVVKQGLFTPGKHLQIKSPDFLVKEKIDYALLLTWNFAEEILKQQINYRKGGGKFIIPIPQMEIM